MITQAELKEILHYDPETGLFEWIKRLGVGGNYNSPAGSRSEQTGYIVLGIQGKRHQAHRVAWVYVYGEWPKNQIDHINHDRTDNRIANLRSVTHQENNKNRIISPKNASGVTGVYLHKITKRWQAQITVNKKRIHLGYFVDKFEAICARKSANNKYGFHENHGEFARRVQVKTADEYMRSLK